jgi:hypothetical protein
VFNHGHTRIPSIIRLMRSSCSLFA